MYAIREIFILGCVTLLGAIVFSAPIILIETLFNWGTHFQYQPFVTWRAWVVGGLIGFGLRLWVYWNKHQR